MKNVIKSPVFHCCYHFIVTKNNIQAVKIRLNYSYGARKVALFGSCFKKTYRQSKQAKIVTVMQGKSQLKKTTVDCDAPVLTQAGTSQKQ